MRYIIKLFPEIMVKGAAVKKKMTRQLAENLKRSLESLNITPQVKWFLDKIEVDVEDGHCVVAEDILLNTPGIEQVLRVQQVKVQPDDLDAIAQTVLNAVAKKIKGKTFVVRARRKGQHPFNSQELERKVGGYLLAHTDAQGVDLHTPQVRVELELENNTLSIVESRLKGLGGYPLGSQGEALSLISGGFDSVVASYLTLRRGVKTHFVFFNLGGTAHELGVQQVAYYLWRRYARSHRLKFISIPFDEVVEGLLTEVDDSYMGVMLKRLMLKAAEQVADELGIDALITGESVAQVSSQTLRNLALIDTATSKLVLRPLAVMDKPEIIRLAEQIGTREFAETMPEYCGVISRNPVTHGSFKRLVQVENQFDFARLSQAVANKKVYSVDELVDQINTQQAVEVVTEIPEGAEVIDIRKPEEAEVTPLEGAKHRIPFYELKKIFPTLSQDRLYLLYCAQGVLSQLHGQHLKEAGFENVRVYRPASQQ